jgi:hypothetical protein
MNIDIAAAAHPSRLHVALSHALDSGSPALLRLRHGSGPRQQAKSELRTSCCSEAARGMGRLASPTEEGDVWFDEEPTLWVTRERSAPKDPFAVGPLPSWVRAR